MKILFVTGDHDCDCKGEGKVDKTGKVHPHVRFNVCLCECVVAKEATVENILNPQNTAHPEMSIAEIKGTVVPK